MRLVPALSRAALLLAAVLAVAACEKVPPRPAAVPAPSQPETADVLKPGVDFVEIRDGMPYEPATGKVEVAEVFGYTCPHCAHFEPLLQAWRARQPGDVKFVAIPAPFGGWWMPYAKAYFVAKDLGIDEKSHAAVFDAIHVQHTLPAAPTIATDTQIAQFYARFGVDPADFARRMSSPAVTQQMRRAEAFIGRSGVDGTPSLVVNGRYRVIGQSPDDALRIVDALVAQERAAH